MIRPTMVLCLTLAAFAAAAKQDEGQGVGGSAFHKNDITYSSSVQTPHVEWAGHLPGGPIRGFFIPSVQYGRDMIELMQRLELLPTTVSIDRNWDTNCWGIGDYYGHEYRGDRDDFRIVYGYVEKDLTGPAVFEVLVIPGLNGWTRMTRASRDAILRRVRDGAGLVLIHPFVGDVKNHPFAGDEREGDNRIWEISPLVGCPDDSLNEGGGPEINKAAVAVGKWEAAKPHFITSGMDPALFPEGNITGAFYKYQAAGEVLIRSGEYPILAVKPYGKGRVAAFGYLEDGFLPAGVNPLAGSEEEANYFSAGIDPISTGIYWDYWEYYYSLLAKTVAWAAGRDEPLELRSLSARGGDAGSVDLSLHTPAARAVAIDVAAKSEYGQQFGSMTRTAELAAGENSISVPTDGLRPGAHWPGGRTIFDVIIRDPSTGSTLNWGGATFTVAKQANLTGVQPATGVYQRGEIISAVVRAAGNLKGSKIRFQVADDLQRILSDQAAPARGETYFYFSLSDFLGKYAHITAELVDAGGTVIDHLRARPVLVVQDARRNKEFNPQVSFGASKHYFQAVRMAQVRAQAVDTGFTWGGSVNNGLNIPRGAFGVYWYDRGPTTPEEMEKAVAEFDRTKDFDALQYLTKKELYRRTGDTRFLAREPSFSDPGFLERLSNIVRAVVRGKSRYNMDYYFVGDEGSLTSYTDPYDFDWGAFALADFRKWLRTEYGTLESLNRKWRSGFRSWDEVVPFTTEQARTTRNYSPWADHRTFMEVSFARAYQLVRDAVVKGDPDGQIALSGTQVTTAYNGCDWYRLDRVIDDFLSYDGGNQWDLHRSFAKPGSMIGFWTGYGSRGLAVQNAIWTAAIHNVLHPNIFWMFAFLNPDFTCSQSAQDMGEVYRILKHGGIGKLLMEASRKQDGVGLHYSMSSVHAASITGNSPEGRQRAIGRDFPADRDGWVRMINDLGMQFDFVSYDQVEKGALAAPRYRVFVLPFSMALSPEEAKAIQDFAQEGGVVIADAGTGIMDEHCAWQAQGLLNSFFGIQAPSSEKRRFMGTKTVEQNAEGDVTGERLTPGIDGPVKVTAEGTRWGLEETVLQRLEAVERDVEADTGKALVRIADTDAVIARQVGKGWAVYLNVLLDRYPDMRSREYGGAAERSLIRALLHHVDVRPAVDVLTAEGKPLSQAQVARYSLGQMEAIAVVKENVSPEGVTGRDGVTVYNDANLGKLVREDITIRLPRKAWVSNIITGEQMGETDAIRTSITTGAALLFGLTQSQVSISLAGPSVGRRGEPLTFEIRATPGGKHLVRCHLFAPDGSFLSVYARSVLIEGADGKVTIRTAYNDAPGTYTLRATDVVSGATTSTGFLLK
jgi:hypothetical protein